MNTKNKTNILLVLTGGTICSFADESGERDSDTEKAQALIVSNFRKSSSAYANEDRVSFKCVSPLDTLSENMTAEHWSTLLDALKTYDFSLYDGVILLHGTDTLAYTSSLLSLALEGISIPVILVSSQLPLYDANTNGNLNFKCAVELIVNSILPNVYAVYANDENGKRTTYIHYGDQLLQCANHSNNFYSSDMTAISDEDARFEGKTSQRRSMPLYECGRLDACVLKLEPYVSIDYSRYSLDGVKAVLHGTYHSSTVATGTCPDSKYSIIYLITRCKQKGIPLFLEPCDAKAYDYVTTGEALRAGALALGHMTSEMCYAKAILGCALGYSGEQLVKYLQADV